MTVVCIACGFNSSTQLDALMAFWNATCAMDPSIHNKDVTAYFVSAAESCQLYVPIVHFTKLQSLDTAQVKEMGPQELQDDEQVKETSEVDEIQEISYMDFFSSKLKSSNISKGQKKIFTITCRLLQIY